MAEDFTREDITKALMAVVAWAGNVAAAQRDLTTRGLNIGYPRLLNWINVLHREEYEQLREKYADQMEKQMAHEFRDVAAQAVQLQKLALANTERRLASNQDHDPSKTAMQLSRVSHTAVEKLMTLTNRPQKITESRSVEEVFRSLAGMGVLVPLPAGSQTHLVDAEAEAVSDAEQGS